MHLNFPKPSYTIKLITLEKLVYAAIYYNDRNENQQVQSEGILDLTL
jgi:hypothetical protein